MCRSLNSSISRVILISPFLYIDSSPSSVDMDLESRKPSYRLPVCISHETVRYVEKDTTGNGGDGYLVGKKG